VKPGSVLGRTFDVVVNVNVLLDRPELVVAALDRVSRRLLEDQYRRLRVVEDVADLAGREAIVHGIEDGAGPQEAEQRDSELRGVVKQQRDAVAGFDAAFPERVREPSRSLVEFGVGQTDVLSGVDDRFPIRVLPRRPRQRLR